jgi:phosphohistidine phosphatase SixA
VAQQRQLNDRGRELACSIGESLHKLRIPVGPVYTSMFQRAVDTGTLLGFGDVTPTADITEGGLVVTPVENNRRMMRKIAATLPAAGTNVKDWFEVREGEASVFKPDGARSIQACRASAG